MRTQILDTQLTSGFINAVLVNVCDVFTEVLINPCTGSQSLSLKVKCVGENCSEVKVKFALEQVIKAQRGSRCIAVFFL
jgi:hypothetical protein